MRLGPNMTTHYKSLLCLILAICLLVGSSEARAQSYPPAWSSSSKYAVGDVVQAGGNWYRAIKAITTPPGTSPTTDYTDWQLNVVLANTTLMIGKSQTFPTLTAAWDYVLYARVADGVYLHLYISSAHGNYSQTLTSPFLLDYGSGARIAILGDSQANDVFTVGKINGFIIDTGHSLNTLSTFTIETSSTNNSSDGLKLDLNASITLAEDLTLSGFSNDIHAEQGASVTLGYGCNIQNFLTNGCLAETGASILFPLNPPNGAGTFIDGNGGGNAGTNNGLVADYGGEIIAQGCVIDYCNNAVSASYGGTVEFTTGFVNDCATGCLATDRGIVNCGSTSFQFCTKDLIASVGGYIMAQGATINDATSMGGSTDGSYIAR
jgi:hypothetical protein